jgi:amino acid transporter
VAIGTWTGQSPAPAALVSGPVLPEPLTYRLKRRLLGPALTRDQATHERLSKRLALGVLSSDCISSSAYGSEEMLVILLPAFGLAAFGILMPLTLVILAVLTIVTLSYRDVVSVYTKTGGSYVVARDQFGPAVAQVAAVALMLDYIVTVAVQGAAGTLAITSAFPQVHWGKAVVWMTVAGILVLFYGNLRGVREAGRTFALPTYFFVTMVGLVILTGIVRELFGDLPMASIAPHDQPITAGPGQSVLTVMGVFLLLQAFANGGSSLTGLEAISNGVSIFQAPEGRNARRTLVVMSTILGSLVLGVSWLAHQTHATPYTSGTPTVISQVAQTALGDGPIAHVLFLGVQLATMLILWTGANTPFSGFPFLASFVAEDQFLPKQLTRRGHRLAFSNGIVVLAVLAIALVVVTNAEVNRLVAFYAIGVFTGFAFAGFGMAKHFATRRTGAWRAKVAVNLVSGVVSTLVVLIFAVVKFTEGAWLVVVIFPLGVLALIRLNRRYRAEAAALSAAADDAGQARPTSNFSRHQTVVLVDNVDLATLGAVRYARSKRSTDLRAVHFVVDEAHADQLADDWCAQPLLADVPLHLVDCPDRRLARAALELAAKATVDPGTDLTLLLPRRTYSPVLGRLLHDRTADEIARATSRLPRVVATIVPFDVEGALDERPPVDGVGTWLVEPGQDPAGSPLKSRGIQPRLHPDNAASGDEDRSTGSSAADGSGLLGSVGGRTPMSALRWRERAMVEGDVRSVRVAALSGAPTLEVELWDRTGGVTLVFYGRRQIAGMVPGRRVRASGMVGDMHGCLAISNPEYELVAPSPV